jgi:Putative lumazine-binding
MRSLRALARSAALSFNPIVNAQSDPLIGVAGSGPAAERSAVVEVLRTYLSVTGNLDQAAIAKSFVPAAVLNSVSADGALRTMSKQEWWGRVSRIPPGTLRRTSTIKLVAVADAAAVARVDVVGPTGSTSVDMFTLQKTREGLRVVNKVLSTPVG